MFDRYDICEAYSLLAHDHGLYDVVDRLNDIGFKPSPILSYRSLSENGREIYDCHAEMIEQGNSPIRSQYC